MITYYKPSGRVAFSSIIYLSIFLILIIPLLSFSYAFSIWNVSFIYINFIITIIFGSLAGLIALMIITLGKIRNREIAILFTLILSTLAIYLHWAIWIHLVADTINIDLPRILENKGLISKFINNFSVAFFPVELFKTIEVIIENGLWKIGGEMINGTGYWIIVLIEAGIIYYLTFKISISKYKDPFCEISNQWMNTYELPKLQLIKNHHIVLDSIEKKNFDFISDLECCPEEKQSHSIFTFYQSDYSCYLKLENKIAYKDFSDSSDHKNHIVIDNISIEKEFMKQFVKLLSSIGKIENNNFEKTEEIVREKVINDNVEKKISSNIYEDKGAITPKKKENEKSQYFKSKKKNPVNLYLSLAIITLIIIGFSIFYFRSNSKIPSKESKEIVKINYSDNIKNLLLAEEIRDFDKIYSFYSPNIKNYWSIKNPSYAVLKKQYEKSWKITSNTKNYIKKIEKINDSIYDLNTEFEYYHVKKKKTISINSKVRFIFDNNGKIVESYGIK